MELARRIDRSQFLPVVYCVKPPPGPGETSLLPELQAAGFEVEFLNARRPTDFFPAVRRLRRFLKERETQIAQSFLFHANLVTRFALRGVGGCCVVSGIRVAERGAAWHRWLDRATHGMVNKYVCVSSSVEDFTARVTKIPRDKLFAIPNGIDQAHYSSAKPADLPMLTPGKRLVTYIGRLEAQKSLTQLIQCAADWLGRLPDCDLLIVGHGPQEAILRSQCESLGISHRVHFLGWRADIPAILAASRLLVLASAWEGMPNVVLEAMASGLPVAVTCVEGISELLGETTSEQSVPYGDWDRFSGLICSILADNSLAERLGRANRQRAADFSFDRMVDAYESLWRSLVASRS